MKSFKDRFTELLLERMSPDQTTDSSEGLENDRGRPQYDSEADSQAFDDSLDADVDPDGYDVEGLGEEVYSAVDDTTQQVIKWAEDIEAFTKKLVDPENPDALLTKLTSVTNIPEFEQAAEQVAKHLQKAISEIGSAKTSLDILASMSGVRRDARRTADQSAVGPSGPY